MKKNTRGLGAVYRRGGVWWIQIRHEGRRIRESSGSTVRSEAVKLLRKRLGEISRGKFPGNTAERLRFDDLASMLVDDYIVNERKTLDRAQLSLKHLREYFGNARAVDITTDRITAYVKERRQDGAAASTVRVEMAALKRAFNLAMRAGRLGRKPVFPVIEVRNTRSGFFEPEELAAVLRELPSHLVPVAEFMYLTGWRKREVLSLQWRQVDFRGGCIRLEPGTTKNDEGRTFPFPAGTALAELLGRQRQITFDAERGTGRIIPWVFHRNGRPLRSINAAWRKACQRAGIDGRIPHDFRRTAVRNLERAGVPRSIAMKLTGHKTESIYRRYAIVSEADLTEGVEKLSRLHRAQSDCLPFVKPSRGRRRGSGDPKSS